MSLTALKPPPNPESVQLAWQPPVLSADLKKIEKDAVIGGEENHGVGNVGFNRIQ